MVAWLRAVLIGLLSWLLPFGLSLCLYPLKKSNGPLFTTIMYLIELATAGLLFAWYFRKRMVRSGEALLVGALWLAMNLVFDYPMFAYGPMKMTVLSYYSEIGLVYLTFPMFAVLAAWLARD
jgi:uncharacterized membrane protein YpjA